MNCCFFFEKGPISDYELEGLRYILGNHDESVKTNAQHSRLCKVHEEAVRLKIASGPKKFVIDPSVKYVPKDVKQRAANEREPGEEG